MEECFYCGAEIVADPDPEYPWENQKHIDHVYPKSKGGTNNPENLVASCRDCNLTKKAKTPEEWRCFCFSEAYSAILRLRWLIPEHVLQTMLDLIDLHRHEASVLAIRGVRDISKNNGRH